MQKNRETYFPYLLACITTIMMFYNIMFLCIADDLGSISDFNSVRSVLSLGVIVIAIFSVLLLFYTNSFLMKRRKKELGLFNILGMEKKHVARIMFLETFYSALISIVIGIVVGILFSKLIILLLVKIIHAAVPFGFEIPILAIVITLVLFAGIFFLNLLYNVIQVYRTKPIDLLKSNNMGEREPKTKWLLTIVGFITLGWGYFIAQTTESPLAALKLFFLAVVLVIIGTYCLFIAGSIAILKMLRKNKRYYYKANHFISISGMIYRMKQNAAGLASICILSTMVIVMLSTTVSMYFGMEDLLDTRYPREISIYAVNVSDEDVQRIDRAVAEQLSRANIVAEDAIRSRYLFLAIRQWENRFFPILDKQNPNGQQVMLQLMALEDYNQLEGASETLADGEVLLFPLSGDVLGDRLEFQDYPLTIKKRLDTFNPDFTGELSAYMTNTYIVVVKEREVIKEIYNALYTNQREFIDLSYEYGFNTNADAKAQIELMSALNQELMKLNVDGNVDGRENSRETFLSLYGSLFFLGLFLGLLFILATVLIIYYKQISEGYDDQQRFAIMQKVGLSRDEVKKAIRSQVLSVFFLPLLMAVVHIAFAFKVITKLLLIFNMTNVQLFLMYTGATILVFALLYGIVYAITAKAYYRIIRQA